MNNKGLQGIEQGRAAFAFKKAEDGSKLTDKDKYKSYVKKIPMLIKTNGLGAAFAFMFSKGGIYQKIGEQICEWLKTDNKQLINNSKVTNFESLMEYITECNSYDYRSITIEVLSFLNWLKRFADGLIIDEEDKNNGPD